MANLNVTERREVERVSVDKLPDALKSFIVRFSFLKQVHAETNYASKKGIGINIKSGELPFEINLNKNIELKTIDGDVKLIGKIIHLRRRGETEWHVGVEFNKSKYLDIYAQMLGSS
jgi:DUF4097 and DUF4098 domain-containing protein YvlB